MAGDLERLGHKGFSKTVVNVNIVWFTRAGLDAGRGRMWRDAQVDNDGKSGHACASVGGSWWH